MKIFLTPKARRNYKSIKEYIREKWGEHTEQEFIHKADALFNLLTRYPELGQIEDKDIRGLQLSSQTRILHRTRENKIIILSFFDVRQHPKKKFS